MSLFSSIATGALGRAGAGAAIGGAGGLWNGDGFGAFATGAGMGAAAGVLGVGGMRHLAANKGWSVAGGLTRGAAALGTGGLNVAKWGAERGANPGLGNALASRIGSAGASFGTGMASLGKGIVNNSVSVNKYGGRALAGLGMGSAGLIGGSIIGSNRGY